MKGRRHQKIKELIGREIVTTQEELAEKLGGEGIAVTQATISRDVKELGLVKVPAPDGRYKYASPEEGKTSASAERLKRLFKECCTGVDCAENVVVVKSFPGTAPAVGEALDTLGLKEVVGTVAGDNTIIAVARSREAAAKVVSVLQTMMAEPMHSEAPKT